MTALISIIVALFFLMLSCGQPNSVASHNSASGVGNGRLICGVTTSGPDVKRLSGCTDRDRLSAAGAIGQLNVLRRGATLDISLHNALTGVSWEGTTQLRFPIGGTGTRARAFPDQPAFATFGCEFDSLLRCGGQ